MKLSYILLVLIALFFFCIGICSGQVSVIHFNSEWNADNNFDITVLKELPKVKTAKQTKTKTKKIRQVEYLDQLLSKKWLSDYFDSQKTTLEKSRK